LLNSGVPLCGHLAILLLAQNVQKIIEDLEESLKHVFRVEKAEMSVTFFKDFAEDEGVRKIWLQDRLVANVAFKCID